ncbi:YjdF family protein [Adlercreutzia sp. R21]|uniref:YjdF family protein n=1 Tax=Adlercreutzia wanghongyangiae TaxID=3111451 RepID=UPI002DBE214B|nr:YjdF family protein [Adlercreutzia sp. R21]MEC4183433.1 YjdF family protein [Adlercreutzia sp. R21]
MQISVSSTLTLYHDGHFRDGVVERTEDGKMSVARIVSGTEPSDEEVLQFVATRWHRLRFAGSVETETPSPSKNPKRRQREAAKELSQRGVSIKARIALSEARESRRQNRKTRKTRARHDAAVK